MFSPHGPRIEQKSVCTFPTTKLKNISCVFCRHQFYVRDLSHLKCVYLPLVLRCGHAGCHQCAAGHRGDPCPLCKTPVDFDRSEGENLPRANVYVIGLLGVARARPVHGVEPDIAFSPVMTARMKQQSAKQGPNCFKCSAQAELKCLKCHDLLCHQCSTKIHGNLKAQGQNEGHFQVMLTDCSKDSMFEIPTCIQHENAALDYYCETCDISGCAHCMCDYHKLHKTMRQTVKNEEYMEEFQGAYDKLAETMQRIRQAQKKLQKALVFPEELQNSETIEAAINQHFTHLHGVLQNIESDLIKDLYEQRKYIARNLTDVQQRLRFQEEQVQSGLVMAAAINEFCGRVSLKDVIEKLEELADLPCHLVEKPVAEDEKIMFSRRASIIEILENHCQLKLPLSQGFDLRTRDELPADYKIEPISADGLSRVWDKSFSSETSAMANSSCQSQSSSRRFEAPALKQKGYNLVQVCYIESPENFYVRLAAQKHNILQLEDELAHYAERKARVPQTVQQNEIYAVKRTGGKWYRGRVKSVHTSHGIPDTYEFFNMEYGRTESRVTKSRVRCIPEQLAAIPQHVINCALYDVVPINGKWGNRERTKMTEFLKTKDGRTATVYMYLVVTKEDKHFVDICTAPSKDGEGKQISIRDTLVFAGFGQFVSSQYLLRTSPLAVRRFFRENLALDTYHSVNCSHVDSPDRMFVQKTGENLAHLAELMTAMANVYSANMKKERLMIHVPEMGMPCAIEKGKGTWYRAIVCGIPAPRTVEVFLVDFGAKTTTCYEKIRKLLETYMITAGQAIRVALADIQPSGGTEWSEQAIQFTREYVEEKDTRVVAFEKNESGYSAAMYINGDTNFAAVLASSSHAVSTGPRSSGVVAASSNPSNPKAESGKVRNSRTLRRNQKQLSRYSARPSVETAESSDPYRVQVKVIRVESPYAIYLADPSQTAAYESMMRQMEKFYNEYEHGAGEIDWQVDFPCVVYSACDRLHCRGKIVTFVEPNEAQVFLYDLAHTVTVPVEELQPLKKKFWNTRSYAFKVKLAGLLPCGGSTEWTKTSCAKLKDIVIENQNSNFYISKVENPDDDDLCVELWVEQVKYDGPLSPAAFEINSINRMLVSAGLALPAKRKSEKTIALAVELKRQISGVARHEKRDEGFRLVGRANDADSDGDSSKNSAAPSDCTLVSNDDVRAAWPPAEQIADENFVAEPTYVDHACVVHLHSIAQSRNVLRCIEAFLAVEYSNLREKPRDLEWTEGDMCIAQYHADKKWYRGEIRSVRTNLIEVEFVDYGNVELCEPETLRMPETQQGPLAMTRTPRQRTKCVIHGLYSNPPDQKWQVYNLDTIHALLVNKECEVSVRKRMEDHLVVSIVLLNPRRELIKHLVEDVRMNVLVDFGLDVTSGNETMTLDDSDNSDDVVIEGYVIGKENNGYVKLVELEKTEDTEIEGAFELREIGDDDDDAIVAEDREMKNPTVKKIDKTAADDLDSTKKPETRNPAVKKIDKTAADDLNSTKKPETRNPAVKKIDKTAADDLNSTKKPETRNPAVKKIEKTAADDLDSTTKRETKNPAVKKFDDSATDDLNSTKNRETKNPAVKKIDKTVADDLDTTKKRETKNPAVKKIDESAADDLNSTKNLETKNPAVKKIDKTATNDLNSTKNRETKNPAVKKIDKTAADDLDLTKNRENDAKTTSTDINENETVADVGDNDLNVDENDLNVGENDLNVGENDLNVDKVEKIVLREKNIEEPEIGDHSGKSAIVVNSSATRLNSDDSNVSATRGNSDDSNVSATRGNSDDSNASVACDADSSAKILNDAEIRGIDEANESTTFAESAPVILSPADREIVDRPEDLSVHEERNATLVSVDATIDASATFCFNPDDLVLSGTANFTRNAGEIESSQEEAMDQLEIISLPDNNFLKDEELVTSTPMNETLDCGLCLPYKPIVFPDSVKIVKAVGAVIGRTDSWLHLLDNQTSEVVTEARGKYEKIMKDMQKRAARQPIMKTYETGSPCCVKFKDGLWYRCFVADCESRRYRQGDMVKVTFGDWGNSEDVSYYELRAMKDEWLEAPFMSLRCRLWGVKEAPGAMANEFSAKLWKAYGGNEEKIVYVELMAYSNQAYDVQIYNDKDCTELIYESLIEEGLFVKDATARR